MKKPDELRSPITHPLVRNWCRTGTNGQELVEILAAKFEAGQALEVLARAKQWGYRDL